MSIISEFISSVREVVSFGSKLQREQRKEIQTVVGTLSDELLRAVNLFDVYLDGIKSTDFRSRLSPYLRDAGSKIFSTFREFQVCAGLYEIKDRFKGLFDPVGASVNLSSKGTIIKLVDDLAQGERMIFDDLGETLNVLRSYADRLDAAATDSEEEIIKSELRIEVNAIKVDLENKRTSIKNTARSIIDSL
ncbi:MAG: hypothetical protein PHI31_04935 [Desulfuromonadaceae bacterium]|nr:hypothetical protein [Desulfuromonadaceae bacterium]